MTDDINLQIVSQLADYWLRDAKNFRGERKQFDNNNFRRVLREIADKIESCRQTGDPVLSVEVSDISFVEIEALKNEFNKKNGVTARTEMNLGSPPILHISAKF